MSKVPDTPENREKCLCPRCPTLTASECAKEKKENIYCATGKSECELTRRGCLCGACPLWNEYSLSKGYFCFNGAAE